MDAPTAEFPLSPSPPEKKGLHAWVRHIRDQEMPIFGHTVQQVVNVSEDQEAPASRLARVILQDASMTARILKVANSPYYNPRRQRISTVSRAVVILGFDTVRAMCLTITLVDSFVQGEPREQLIRELARAIHAAVQARTVALERGDDSPEEVFVATLLYHLGDLAFWCFGGDHAQRLAELRKDPAYSDEEAEQEVLGFRLQQLTVGLAAEWKLNELLTNTLKDPRRAGSRGRNVTLSYRLAVAAEKGWNDPQVKDLQKQLGELMDQAPEQALELLHGNAKEAARIAHYYGANTAAKTIPVPGAWQLEEEGDESEGGAAEEAAPEPDGLLQLRVLRELAMLLESDKADFNLVMELVLEGMHRGVGLDRTLFALLTPDRRGLRGKYGVGRGALAERFQFVYDPAEENALFRTLDGQEPAWIGPDRLAEVPASVQAVVGETPFLLGPILVNQRPIGLFYADRAPSRRPLDEEDFEGFKHFVQQANLAITHLSGQGR